MILQPSCLLTSMLVLSSAASAFSSLRSGVARGLLRNNHAATTTAATTTTTTARSSSNYDYDFVVIGGGSGGVRASRIASGHGAKTLLIEPRLQHGIAPDYSAIGGTCVNVGCVPKKLMVFASRYVADTKEAEGYGWKGPTAGQFDWDHFMAAKDKEITRLNTVYNNNVLKSAGVEVSEGFGRMVDDHSVEITVTETGETKTVTAANVCIAVGGWPFVPDIPGKEHGITSNEIFYLKEQPKRVVCVGGGFIALEFATILEGLGSEVTVMYRGDMFLRGFDTDLRTHLRDEIDSQTSIDLQFNTDPQEIIKNDDGSLTVVTDKGDRVECDQVLFATGRKGKIDKLQLDKAGVESENSFIHVNDYSQTNVPHIYAVGDVTDRIALTPVALMEGHRLADTVFGGMDRTVDHDLVASTVFTNPELATCGLTEEEALAKYPNLDIFKTRFNPMKHSFPGRKTFSMFKLIVDHDTDVVVGCHLATDGAGEMMQGVAIAMKMGATKADFDATIGIHPTSAEELVTMRSPSWTYRNGKRVED